MTITVSPPTLACRRYILRVLARNWGQRGTAACMLALAATVHESLNEPLKPSCTCGLCLTCLWDAYLNDQALLDAYEAGEIGPGDIDPDGEITAIDREGAIRDQLAACAAGTADVLLRGWPAPKAAAA